MNATLSQTNWRLYVWYKVLMMMEIVERLRNRNIQKMQWKRNQVLEPIFHGHLWKRMLRNAAKLKISINNSAHSLWDFSFNKLQFDTTILIIHSSEIAAHKIVWKIIWNIEDLHSKDKFRYPITVTDVTLTLIKKKPLSLVENIVLNFNYTTRVCNLYH